jgi:hypothetical protein
MMQDEERQQAVSSPGAVQMDDLLGVSAAAQQERLAESKKGVLADIEVGEIALGASSRDRDVFDTRAGVIPAEGGELELFASDAVTSGMTSEALSNLDQAGDASAMKNFALAGTFDVLRDMREGIDAKANEATALQLRMAGLEEQYAEESKPIALWRQIFASVGGGMVTYGTGDANAGLRFMTNLYARREKTKKSLLELRSIASQRLGEIDEEVRLTRGKYSDIIADVRDDFADEERYSRERAEKLRDKTRDELLADVRSQQDYARRIAEGFYSRDHQETINQKAATMLRRHDREMAELRSTLNIDEAVAASRLTGVALNIAQYNMGAAVRGIPPLTIAEEKQAFRSGVADEATVSVDDKDLWFKIVQGAHEAAIEARRQLNFKELESLTKIQIDLGNPQLQAATGGVLERDTAERVGQAVSVGSEAAAAGAGLTIPTNDGLFTRDPAGVEEPNPLATPEVLEDAGDLTEKYLNDPAKVDSMMNAANHYLESGNANAAVIAIQTILSAYKQSPDHARYIENSPNVGARITHMLARLDEETGQPVSELMTSAFANEIDNINRKQKIITMEERMVKSSVQSAAEQQRRLSDIRGRLAQLEAQRTEEGILIPGFQNARDQLKLEEQEIQGKLGEALNALRDAGYTDPEIQQFVSTFSGLENADDLMMFFDPPEDLSGVRNLQ